MEEAKVKIIEMKEMNKRLCEVEYILSKLEKSYQEKIPKEIWQFINENKDKTYVYNYDDNKKLIDNNIHIDTIAILTYINIQYLLNEEQKKLINNKLLNDNSIFENKMREKYNPDNLFKKQKNEVLNYANSDTTKETAIIEYKEKSFLQKIFDKIKNLFRKN